MERVATIVSGVEINDQHDQGDCNLTTKVDKSRHQEVNIMPQMIGRAHHQMTIFLFLQEDIAVVSVLGTCIICSYLIGKRIE